MTVSLFIGACLFLARDPLSVRSDFEGGSAKVVEIDQQARRITFMPGGAPARGWPCWWYFRIDGVKPGETITLKLIASTAVADKPGSKPLAASWSRPSHAACSADGTDWRQTGPGTPDGDAMIYKVEPSGNSVYVAWGPPCTPSTVSTWMREWSKRCPQAKVEQLCVSREGRPVPMLRVMAGDTPPEKRIGVWVQARQHAWESGSSWVAKGFGDWLTGESAGAAWLRDNAEVVLVPVMDIDNAATGNGGKDALPQDHNRDWSDQPHWNEVKAAMARISEWIAKGRMDVFLDLHNPAPGDPSFFYVLDDNLMAEKARQNRDRFVEMAYGRISRIKPLIPMSNRPKYTGPKYHPLWKQISAAWVAMNGNPQTVSLCLETIWNYKNSNTAGYMAVGSNLAEATQAYLAERKDKP